MTNPHRVFRNDNGVGTAILIKKDLKCESLTVLNVTAINSTSIKLKFKGKQTLTFHSIYIPCYTGTETIINELNQFFIANDFNSIIAAGDLNKSRGNNETGITKGVNTNRQLVNLINPAGPSFRAGTQPDGIPITTDIQVNKYCHTKDLKLEHKLIHTVIKFNSQPAPSEKRQTVRWTKANWSKFRTIAQDHLTCNVPNNSNISNDRIDSAIDQLTKDINATIDNALPIGLSGRGSAMEYNNIIDHWFKERRRLKGALRREKKRWSPSEERVAHIKAGIKEASKFIDDIIKEAGDKQLEDKITKINSNQNKFRQIASLMGKKGTLWKIKLKLDNKTIDNDDDKLRVLKNFYAELYEERTPVCAELNAVKLTCNSLNSISRIIEFDNKKTAIKPKNSNFTDLLTTLKIINSIPNKTSHGEDNIPNIVIKNLPISYTCTLVKIVNHCLNNSYFPTAWKKAKIITIPKKSGFVEPKDLRPISMTSNLGKILESVILIKLKETMSPGTIPNFQFDFQEIHSTIDALSVINNKIQSDLKNKHCTAIASLNIKKAFDSVWHAGLLHKVYNTNCNIFTVNIIKSFCKID